MVLRINWELPDEAPSLPLCRRMLRAILQQLAVDASRAFDIELVLCEAAANVIGHAYPDPGRTYQVTVECLPDRVRLQVVDEGRGFAHQPMPDPDPEQTAGRGLWLIERLADVAAVCTVPGGGCRVIAEFALPQPPALLLLPGD